MKAPGVRIVGVGSAGCRTLSVLAREWAEIPPAIAAHTQAARLREIEGVETLLLGGPAAGGLSTGGDPELGRRAAEESLDRLRGCLEGAQVVWIVAGLGGGTGGGAAPVIAREAREGGALTLAFCTLPFVFEGPRRRSAASRSLAELRSAADAVVVFSNQRLLEWAGRECSMEESFRRAGEVVASSLRALWKLISQPGLISLDYADIRKMASASGGALSMAQAEADGPDRAAEAVQRLLQSPLLEHGSVIGSAEAVLAGVLGGPDLALQDVEAVMNGILGAARPDVEVHFGARIDPESGGRIHVTLLAAERKAEPGGNGAPAGGDPAAPGAKRREEQGDLPLGGQRKGRFDNTEPTIRDGQDLDVPTYLRRKIRLSGAG